MYLYIYIYIYNIHNIVHISSNMRVWRIYLEIASLAASWRIVLCIFFFAHMDQNAWKLTTATGYGLPEWKKGGGGMNKIETSDVIGSVFYLHELIAYQWILALFFFCPTCCDILRKWQTRSLFILLECEEKLSNARLCGLQQILSLGSLALKKIARWHMKTTISPHARLVNASQRVRRQVIAENFVNGKTPKMIADKLRVLKISQRSGQSNEWQ